MNIISNQEIQEYHRVRHPYLLIDRIEEINPGISARGIKYFTENEWVFQCIQQKNQPVPFTVLVEIMAQVLLMAVLAMDGNKGKELNFFAADDVHMFQLVFPGDTMIINAYINSWKRGIAFGKAEGLVDGKLVCTGEFKYASPDTISQFMPKISKQNG